METRYCGVSYVQINVLQNVTESIQHSDSYTRFHYKTGSNNSKIKTESQLAEDSHIYINGSYEILSQTQPSIKKITF